MAQSVVSIDMINEKQFDGLQNLIVRKAGELFKNKALSHQVANTLLLSILKENPQEVHVVTWVDKHLPQTVESYFNDLRLYCFKYALDLTQRNEIAEDIAQQSIIELLTAEQEILNIKAWLRGLVSNMTRQYIRHDEQDKIMARNLAIRDKATPAPKVPSVDNLYKKLNRDQVKSLLSGKDYLLYKRLKRYKNLVEYARAMGISHVVARKQSAEIRTNLKAAYLKATGWNGTPMILSYRRLMGIKRFLQSMIDIFGTQVAQGLDKYQLAIDKHLLLEAFEGVAEVTDWGVTMLSDNRYRVYLCYKGEAEPVMIVIYTNINRANRITITDCHRIPLQVALPDPSGRVDLFRNGKPTMTYKEILRLLS